MVSVDCGSGDWEDEKEVKVREEVKGKVICEGEEW